MDIGENNRFKMNGSSIEVVNFNLNTIISRNINRIDVGNIDINIKMEKLY